MKKLLLTALAAVFSSVSVFALNPEDFSLTVEPVFGVKNGTLGEYVFLKQSNYDDDLLSYLDWEIKNEIYAGFKAAGGYRNIFASITLKTAFSQSGGIMTDSDWFNNIPSGVSGGVADLTSCSNYKTCYSESDNYIDSDFTFEIKSGYTFRPTEVFTILPYISYEYSDIKMSGKNGWGKYGDAGYGSYGYYFPWNNNSDLTNRSEDFTGKKVISYERAKNIFWLGSDFHLNLPQNIFLNLGAQFSPYIYVLSIDQHHLTYTDYADETPGYFSAFRFSADTGITIKKSHTLSIGFSYFYMQKLRGTNYSKSSSKSTYSKDTIVEGGADEYYWEIYISYKYKIF